jgi:hypothetical protein
MLTYYVNLNGERLAVDINNQREVLGVYDVGDPRDDDPSFRTLNQVVRWVKQQELMYW